MKPGVAPDVDDEQHRSQTVINPRLDHFTGGAPGSFLIEKRQERLFIKVDSFEPCGPAGAEDFHSAFLLLPEPPLFPSSALGTARTSKGRPCPSFRRLGRQSKRSSSEKQVPALTVG